MIRFVTSRGHGYTLEKTAKALGRNHCAVWHYDRLFRHRTLPGGTWIFTDHERLAPFELCLAAKIADRLIEGGATVLNHPARVRCRAEMLGALRRKGINSFSVWRAEDAPAPDAFPVFIRNEYDHRAPDPELIASQEALDRTLEQLVASGTPLRGLLVIQHCGEEIRSGVWRKLSTFRIDGNIIAHHHVIDYQWVAKESSDPERLMREEALGQMIDEERAFVAENLYAETLSQAFEAARIDYGRADFGIVGGKPQIYEINTNPNVPMGGESITPKRTETLRIGERLVLEALRGIDIEWKGNRIPIKDPDLERHQHLRGWFNVSRWRP